MKRAHPQKNFRSGGEPRMGGDAAESFGSFAASCGCIIRRDLTLSYKSVELALKIAPMSSLWG